MTFNISDEGTSKFKFKLPEISKINTDFVVDATNLLKADGKYELDINDGGNNLSNPFSIFSFTTPEGKI